MDEGRRWHLVEHPASYGPADASITGGNGVDWKAVAQAIGVIQRVPPEGRTVLGLGQAAGISSLTRHGFVRLSGQTMSLTAAVHDDRVRVVEADWREAFGSARIAALRRALQAIC